MSDYDEEVEEKAGCLGLGASFLFPIVGIICYFVKKDDVENPDSYLIAAAAGFALSILFNLLTLMF